MRAALSAAYGGPRRGWSGSIDTTSIHSTICFQEAHVLRRTHALLDAHQAAAVADQVLQAHFDDQMVTVFCLVHGCMCSVLWCADMQHPLHGRRRDGRRTPSHFGFHPL
jgi:hypothetical protein